MTRESVKEDTSGGPLGQVDDYVRTEIPSSWVVTVDGPRGQSSVVGVIDRTLVDETQSLEAYRISKHLVV